MVSSHAVPYEVRMSSRPVRWLELMHEEGRSRVSRQPVVAQGATRQRRRAGLTTATQDVPGRQDSEERFRVVQLLPRRGTS